jgi:predicted alpha/beta hydrolase family esterase
MLARLLQALIFCMVASAVAGVWFFWSRAPALAIAGVFAVSLLYVPFLGLQFLAVRQLNRNDPSPRASWGQLLRAWWGEVVVVPPVFFWRLPFAWNKVPDDTSNTFTHRGKRGVVFIHGFICNRGFWTPWLVHIKHHRRAFIAVNLQPVFGSIDDYAELIDRAVQQVTLDTGLPPLVVCHSMGGVAVRAWLRHANADHRVHHIVTIGSPHHGTWLGRFSFMTNARQMNLSNDWLLQLAADEPAARYKLFTCYYSNCDNIVFPASTATLAGADNRLITGAAHVALAFDQTVMRESLARI